MTEKKVILTIGLICCGRPETERCLASLVPILENVDSELVVVDTGCNEEQLQMVKKYATKVVPFTWVNDFATARNVSIENASGQWFMYIDDDEWFLDTSGIIDFFKSGNYKNFDGADYIQRNYRTMEAKEWVDVTVGRARRLDDGLKFTGKIHEYLIPEAHNQIQWDVAVGHFGYVFDDKEALQAHSKRNCSLLLEMIDEEPENMRWPVHLAQEYRSLREFDKLYDLCQKYIEKLAGAISLNDAYYRDTFAIGRAMAIDSMENADYARVLALVEETFDSPDMLLEPGKAGVAVFGIEASYMLAEYEKCVKYCKIYFDGYKLLEENPAKFAMESGIFMNEIYDQIHMEILYGYYEQSKLKIKQSKIIKDDKYHEMLELEKGLREQAKSAPNGDEINAQVDELLLKQYGVKTLI